jgi:hypothetical protein
MLRDWFAHHPRTVRVFLLGVAAFNGWVSYLLYPHYPQLAVFHGALAGLLLGAVIASWPRQGTL